MAIPLIGICWKTAAALAVGAGVTGGVLLHGKNREEEERRAREIEELRRNAQSLTESTGALREVIALQQRAAEVELGLTHRIERLSETLAEMRVAQATLQGSLEEKQRDVKEAGEIREQLEKRLAEVSRAAEERGDAYNRAAFVLSAAQEENGKLRESVSELQRSREEAQQDLADLRVAYRNLMKVSENNRESCNALTQALAKAEASVKGYQKQLSGVQEMQAFYDREIARLGQAVVDLGKSRTEAHEIREKLSTASLEEVPRYRRLLDAYCEMEGEYDGDLKLQIVTQVSVQEANDTAIALALSERESQL